MSFTSILSSIDPNTFFMVFFSILVLLIILLLYFQIRTHIRMNRVTYPTYEYVIKQAQDKANEIIHEAAEDAREMRVNAELKGMKDVAQQKLDTKNIEEKYEEALTELVKKSEQAIDQYREEAKNLNQEQLDKVKEGLDQASNRLENQIDKFENQYGEFLRNVTSAIDKQESEVTEKASRITNSLQESLEVVRNTLKNVEEKQKEVEGIVENNIDNYLSGIKKATDNQIEGLSQKFDEMFKDIDEETRRKIGQKIDERLEDAEKSIDSYRLGWMRMLDREILDLVERTTKIALQKGISADEQADLVYFALQEAKDQGVFGEKEE